MAFINKMIIASNRFPGKCQGNTQAALQGQPNAIAWFTSRGLSHYRTEEREIAFKTPEFGECSESTKMDDLCDFHYNLLKTSLVDKCEKLLIELEKKDEKKEDKEEDEKKEDKKEEDEEDEEDEGVSVSLGFDRRGTFLRLLKTDALERVLGRLQKRKEKKNLKEMKKNTPAVVIQTP
jgi:hypothetical protein